MLQYVTYFCGRALGRLEVNLQGVPGRKFLEGKGKLVQRQRVANERVDIDNAVGQPGDCGLKGVA